MAIKYKQGTNTVETVTGTIITGSTQYVNDSATYYSGEITHNFSNEVKYVTLEAGTADGIWFTISGSSVVFKYSASTAGAKGKYVATVTYGPPDIVITDVKASSGATINYVNLASDPTKYIWTRPTSFGLQLPWGYLKSWSLTREAGSKSVDSTTGTIKSNSSLATSGTTKYTLATSDGIRYGDKLKFTYTAKPGASVGYTSGTTVTVDPTFEIVNTTASKTAFPDPTVAVSDDLGWVEGDWNSIKNKSNTECFTVAVTNNSPVPCSVWAQDKSVGYAECYYRQNLNLVTYTDTSCRIATTDGTTISMTADTYIGEIGASTTKTFTLKIVPSVSVTKAWPKHAWVSVKLVAKGDHMYSPDNAIDSDYGGQWTTGGSGGSSGPSYGS